MCHSQQCDTCAQKCICPCQGENLELQSILQLHLVLFVSLETFPAKFQVSPHEYYYKENLFVFASCIGQECHSCSSMFHDDDVDDYDVYYLTIPFERFFGNQGFCYVMWSFKVLRNYVLIVVCPIIFCVMKLWRFHKVFKNVGLVCMET